LFDKVKLSAALVCAVTATLFAGCGGPSVLNPSQPSFDAMSPTVVPESAPKACKGQTNTKQYAVSKPQGLSAHGGSACIPKFGGWGGIIELPGLTSGGGTVTITSSTTPYNPGEFPPSTDAIFYMQLGFSEQEKFSDALKAGSSLASDKLKEKRPYTVEAAVPMGSLWQALPDCYATAVKSKYGPSISGLGFPLKNFGGSSAVIMIYSGKMATTKC
jgi:hypothetical protein